MSPSPDKMFIERSGMSIRPDNEPTATASVGPKAAPKAKQAANGKRQNHMQGPADSN